MPQPAARRLFSKTQFEAISQTLNVEVRRRLDAFRKVYKTPSGLVDEQLKAHRKANTFPTFLEDVTSAETSHWSSGSRIAGKVSYTLYDDPAHVALRAEADRYEADLTAASRSFLGDISLNGIPADITVDGVFAAADAEHDARVKALGGTVLRLSRPKTAALKKKAAKTIREIGKLAKPRGRKA